MGVLILGNRSIDKYYSLPLATKIHPKNMEVGKPNKCCKQANCDLQCTSVFGDPIKHAVRLFLQAAGIVDQRSYGRNRCICLYLFSV